MVDIESLPTSELIADLAASITDIELCRVCARLGVTHHKDGLPLVERIRSNGEIIGVIGRELQRRNAQGAQTS